VGEKKTYISTYILFVFQRHSTLEPASVACDDKQGDLFYSVGPHGNLEFWNPELRINKLNGPERSS